jgi:hypothetical protein
MFESPANSIFVLMADHGDFTIASKMVSFARISVITRTLKSSCTIFTIARSLEDYFEARKPALRGVIAL